MPTLDHRAAELPVNTRLSNYTLLLSDIESELQFRSASTITSSLPRIPRAIFCITVVLTMPAWRLALAVKFCKPTAAVPTCNGWMRRVMEAR
ncbi:MAG: hypothetical protein QF493_10195 [Rhodospirillales bacterium]|nr:hypothetical protein [Rhodospirillales bacterium]